MKREEILSEAARLVSSDREEQHGNPSEGFAATAMVWSAIIGHPVSPAQVPLCLIGLKLVRANSGKANPDDFVDIGGYSSLAGEMVTEQ